MLLSESVLPVRILTGEGERFWYLHLQQRWYLCGPRPVIAVLVGTLPVHNCPLCEVLSGTTLCASVPFSGLYARLPDGAFLVLDNHRETSIP